MSEVRETIFEADQAHTIASTSTHLTTFAVLVALAVGAIGVGMSDLGDIKVVVSLTIAAVQTVVLGYFFMDLKQADKLTWLCVGSAGFWLLILFVFTLTDYFTRHYATI